MRAFAPLLLLVLATVLEVSGDAIIRVGLRSPGGAAVRIGLMLVGGVGLSLYGLTLNSRRWIGAA